MLLSVWLGGLASELSCVVLLTGGFKLIFWAEAAASPTEPAP